MQIKSHERVPGTEEGEKGSCRPKGSKKKKKASGSAGEDCVDKTSGDRFIVECTMTEQPKAGYLGDYQFLNRDFPVPAGVRHDWLLDDILLTVLIFLGAAYDFTSGIFNFAMTNWAIEMIQGFNETMDDRFVTLTRVRGVSGIEGGLAGLLVGIYRVARWGRKQRFNGINFQMVFFIQTVGRSMQLYLQLPGWDTPHPPGLYMLITRLSIAAFAFLLSLYTYRSSWRWLWDDIMHPI